MMSNCSCLALAFQEGARDCVVTKPAVKDERNDTWKQLEKQN